MLDASGANTTAAAAILAIEKHHELKNMPIAVLGGTGSVGLRVCQLLSQVGAKPLMISRSLDRARELCDQINSASSEVTCQPMESKSESATSKILMDCSGVIAAGAAGIQFVSSETLAACGKLEFAVDLNAVPPAGIEGIDAMDLAQQRHGMNCFGALAVGGLKMKIHKQSIRRLFEANDQLLDLKAIFETARELDIA